jgi:hypothetical protein
MSLTERVVQSRRQRAERPQPEFIIRAKVGAGWTSIGAAWPLRSGEKGYSFKITSIPLQWDGRAVLLPPLEDGQDPEPHDDQ